VSAIQASFELSNHRAFLIHPTGFVALSCLANAGELLPFLAGFMICETVSNACMENI